jgi:hypothetical protein
MRSPKTIRWNVPISKADFERLMQGFSPSCMEERWVIKSKHLPMENIHRVRFARSWTRNPYHELFVSEEGPAIKSMTYESVNEADQEITEDEAKGVVIRLARGLLECEIEAIPKEDKK